MGSFNPMSLITGFGFGGGGGGMDLLLSPFNYISDQASKQQSKAARENIAMWMNTAYPNKANVSATATQNRGNLAQARANAEKNLPTTLATRGFGSGSASGTGAFTDINRDYMSQLAKMLTELTKYENTPMWGPQGATVSPVQSGGEMFADLLSKAAGFAAGGGMGGFKG